jgi:hypothetical protein
MAVDGGADRFDAALWLIRGGSVKNPHSHSKHREMFRLSAGSRVARQWLSTLMGLPSLAELEQAAQLPPGKVRDYLLENINRQWYARDPEAAAAFAESHGLSKLPDRFTTDPRPIDPRAALAWLSTRRPAGGSSWAKDFENGFKAAAEADPQAALATATELLAKSPVNDRTLDATRTVARTWGQRDWPAGWDWAAARALQRAVFRRNQPPHQRPVGSLGRQPAATPRRPGQGRKPLENGVNLRQPRPAYTHPPTAHDSRRRV